MGRAAASLSLCKDVRPFTWVDRQLARLGETACSQQWGVDEFENSSRDIHDFARRTGRLPEQRGSDEMDFRSILHRDGSVLSAPTLSVRLVAGRNSRVPSGKARGAACGDK